MRIAVLTSYFPTREQPYRGHSAYQTLRELRHRAELHIYCILAAYPRFLHPVRFDYYRADPAYSPPDLRATYLEYPAIPKLSRPLNGWLCSRCALPYLRKAPPDLILNYGIYPEGYAAVRAGRRLGLPAVVCAIGSDLRRIPDAATRWLTRQTLRRASFVLAVSEELRQQSIRLGAPPERSRTLLNGCDTSLFHPMDRAEARAALGIPLKARLLVYVGRMDPAKGLRELIEVLPWLPEVDLALIGEGSFQRELEAQAARAGVARRVRFPGRCASPEVARWLAAADLFCLPSYSEGCPNVVIEALACGRPVVATHVGGIPELLDRDCGILVAPRDAPQLARALKEALARPWDEAAISRRFQRSWRQVAEETFEACRAALGLTGQQAVG